MTKVFVYSGLPGSGKSTLIKERHPGAFVFSADNFFMKDGEYAFDPAKIGQAHADCFRRFIECLKMGVAMGSDDVVVVDNTNTTAVEISPYMLAADAFGAQAEVVTVKCDPMVAHARNTHGVPEEAQKALAAQLDERKLMPWWPNSEVQSG